MFAVFSFFFVSIFVAWIMQGVGRWLVTIETSSASRCLRIIRLRNTKRLMSVCVSHAKAKLPSIDVVFQPFAEVPDQLQRWASRSDRHLLPVNPDAEAVASQRSHHEGFRGGSDLQQAVDCIHRWAQLAEGRWLCRVAGTKTNHIILRPASFLFKYLVCSRSIQPVTTKGLDPPNKTPRPRIEIRNTTNQWNFCQNWMLSPTPYWRFSGGGSEFFMNLNDVALTRKGGYYSPWTEWIILLYGPYVDGWSEVGI